MAKIVTITSDLSGAPITGEPQRLVFRFADEEKHVYWVDLSSAEARELAEKGTRMPARGRPRKRGIEQTVGRLGTRG